MKQRIISFVLVFLILTVLISCGTSTPTETTAPVTASGVPSPDSSEAETTLAVPEYNNSDYNGYSFRIIKYATAAWQMIPNDLYSETLTGEQLNDSVFNRNKKVETNLNVNLECSDISSGKLLSTYTNAVAAGSDDFDTGMPALNTWTSYLSKGVMRDMAEFTGIDYSAPWFDQNANDAISYNGKIYATVSDITYTDKLATFVTFYNKNKAEDLKLGNLYQLVKDGKWTYDTMLNYSADLAKDLNGDGLLNSEDAFGLASQNDMAYLVLNAAGRTLCEKKDDHTITFTALKDETSVTILQKSVQLLNSNTFFNRQHANPSTTSVTKAAQMMMENRILFLIRPLQTVMDLRSMEADFGILPMPKYTEEQEQYCSGLTVWEVTPLTVPKTNVNVAVFEDVSEMMACESYYTVIDPFYNLVLDTKLTRDTDSSAMLDIIFANRVYDICIIGGFGSVFQLLYGGIEPTSLVSSLKSAEEPVNAAIRDFLGYFK